MPASKRPSREVVERDYRKMTAADMAAKHGVGPSTVRNWVVFYGLERKRPKVELAPGDTVGTWEIVARVGTTKTGAVLWSVRCSCGKAGKKTTGHLLAAAEKGHSCGCRKWTGAGQMPGKYWKAVAQKARLRGIEVAVTAAEAWAVFERQAGRCALSGLPLVFGRGQNASLDRKDSALPYTAGNIQWVHKHINWMKNRFDNETFLGYCQMVVKHNLANGD